MIKLINYQDVRLVDDGFFRIYTSSHHYKKIYF